MVLRCFSRRGLIPSRRIIVIRDTSRSSNDFKPSICNFGGESTCNGKQRSSFSTSSSNPSLNSNSNSTSNKLNSEVESTEGIKIGPSSSEEASSTSQSSTSSHPSLTQSQSQSTSTSSQHPLISNLLREIYSTHQTPSSDRVWNSYLLLTTTTDQPDDLDIINPLGSATSSVQLPLINQLKLEHHKLVLRAISPDVVEERWRKKESSNRRKFENIETDRFNSLAGNEGKQKGKNGDGAGAGKEGKGIEGVIPSLPRRTRGNQNPSSSSSSSTLKSNQIEISKYMQRVWFIISQMRSFNNHLGRGDQSFEARSFFNKVLISSPSLQPQPVPDISDFNHILSNLSKTSSVSDMISIWTEIMDSDLKVTRATYHHLLRCLSNDLQERIERNQLDEFREKMKGMVDRRGEGSFSKSWLKKNDAKGSKLDPEGSTTISTSKLGSSRTHSLLQDMLSRGIKPNNLTIDLALRNLRITGDLQGINSLITQYFGIDLKNPDEFSHVLNRTREESNEKKYLKPSVHTLNTLLMTLGEQRTVGEMITAFETITKPLPLGEEEIRKLRDELEESVRNEGGGEIEGNLFKLDWSVFKGQGSGVKDSQFHQNVNSPEFQAPSSKEKKSGYPEVFKYRHPSSISPNTKTFTIMMKHVCSSPNPMKISNSSNPISSPTSKSSTKPSVSQLSEIELRRNGSYITLAKYLLSEASSQYRSQISRTSHHLGFSLKFDSKPSIRQRSIPFGVAYFLPPTLTITWEMINPLVSLAFNSRAKSKGKGLGKVDYDLLSWIQEFLQKALRDRQIEIEILESSSNRFSTTSNSNIDQIRQNLLLKDLRHQLSLTSRTYQPLEIFLEDLNIRIKESRIEKNVRMKGRRDGIKEKVERKVEMERLEKLEIERLKEEKERERETRKRRKEIEESENEERVEEVEGNRRDGLVQ